jgi:CheY-like chemotaxis protein
MGEERKYCMCCGEDVPVNVVERQGQVELTCIHCGFTLDIVAPEAPPRAARCIIAVDDAETHRALLAGLLVDAGLADEVLALHSGAEFVATLSRRLADDLPVDLVVLDIEMPAMDGFTAARFLRTIETNLRRPHAPLIFFSGRQADDNLRRQMALFRPAWYFNKGTGGGGEELPRRVGTLVGHIARIVAGPAAATA